MESIFEEDSQLRRVVEGELVINTAFTPDQALKVQIAVLHLSGRRWFTDRFIYSFETSVFSFVVNTWKAQYPNQCLELCNKCIRLFQGLFSMKSPNVMIEGCVFACVEGIAIVLEQFPVCLMCLSPWRACEKSESWIPTLEILSF